MGRFEKGNSFGKGRPAGKLNASTEAAKLTLARLASKGLDNISQDIDKIREENPIKAAEIYLKLLEYVVPKLRSILHGWSIWLSLNFALRVKSI